MKFRAGLLLLIMIGYASVQAMAQDPKEIIRKAEEKLRGTESAYSEMKIETVRPKYTRTMTLKSWSKGDDYSLILITSPAREKGTTFLKRGKEVWNWVPTIERTIKMPPSMMSQSWMGTDMSNDDLVRETSNENDYTHKMLESVVIDGHDCYQIELTPLPDVPVVWGKVVVCIDKENYVQRKAEMYDEDGYLVNTTLAGDVKQMDGQWVATRMEIIPNEEEGHKTIVYMEQMVFNETYNEDFFTVRNMKVVR